MTKENVIILHPREWATAEYAKDARFNYHHVSIGGEVPKKRDGTPTYDGYADVATKEGGLALRQAVKELKPRAFLFWMHGDFPNTLLEFIRNTAPNCKIVHWYSNHRYQLPKGVAKVLPYIDALLMNDDEPDQFKMYHGAGIKHVFRFWDGYEAHTPEVIAAMNSKEKEVDDCFFGGHSYLRKSVADGRFRFPYGKLRYDFIVEVAKHFKLALHGSEAYKWPGIELRKPVFHPEYTRAMRRSKVTLNVNHFPFAHAYTRRTIRSIFAGRAHVTFYIPGMEDDFENGRHLFWFHTIEEGIEQIDRLLKDKPLRDRMAAECLALAMERHTFRNRLVEFEDILEEIGV